MNRVYLTILVVCVDYSQSMSSTKNFWRIISSALDLTMRRCNNASKCWCGGKGANGYMAEIMEGLDDPTST